MSFVGPTEIFDAQEQSGSGESIGRIEVAPEVIMTIVRFVAQNVDGVAKMGNPPSDRLFRRATKQDGVVLHYDEGKLVFDIYVLMDPHVNIMQASRKLQAAVVEAIDKIVGVPVEAVNIHVDDVFYEKRDRT